MRLQIDSSRKTIRIDENSLIGVNMGEFIREIMELLPNDWDQYKLIQSEGTINWPTQTPPQVQQTPPLFPQIWYSNDTASYVDFFN